ncbi:PiggyBac transposable element-derived protein 3 [Trichinella patagoniensis]|uniref:PiggyBac transposable element-derived protein 3 n=1 Tax=Trichinella patagoniensis TaxID=990121 RepID=A0A0V0Z6Z5_9BILA|nr:PiggyBac transposable element-derived protein 3 [Trichinella patagoniensis]
MTLEKAKNAIAVSDQYSPDYPEDEFDPAGKLEVEEVLDMEECEDKSLKSEDLDIIFPVDQLQPNQNPHRMASLAPLEVQIYMPVGKATAGHSELLQYPQEMRQFIELILLSGYHCVLERKHYWPTQPDMGTQVAISSMSQKWYLEIKKVPNAILIQHGMFHEELSIDELIVLYFGRHGTKMLMKGKMIQFGYKVLMLCGRDGYSYHMIIDPGKEFQASKVSLSTRVVTDMIAVIQENSRTIRQTLSLLQGKVESRCINAEHIRGKKWYWPLFVRAVNVAAVAACQIRCFSEERSHSPLVFRRQGLVGFQQSERISSPRAASGLMSQLPDIQFDGVSHIRGAGPQARCKECKRNTRNMCTKCSVRVHAVRGKQCFGIYHRQK